MEAAFCIYGEILLANLFKRVLKYKGMRYNKECV